MYQKYFSALILVVCIATFSCTQKQQDANSDANTNIENPAQEFVDRSIELSGGDLYKQKKIKFSFRGIKFTVVQNDTSFYYERIVEKDGESVKEVLHNGNLTREKGGIENELTGRDAELVHEAINSVPYFAMLPYKLNDGAVIKAYEGEVAIKGTAYHKVKVTFEGEGSGTSPDNVFYYWFNKETGFMDYLAYSKGGNRFREAYNQRVINGIRFADYVNYKSDDLLAPNVNKYDKLFEDGELRELSRIVLDDVQVLDIE